MRSRLVRGARLRLYLRQIGLDVVRGRRLPDDPVAAPEVTVADVGLPGAVRGPDHRALALEVADDLIQSTVGSRPADPPVDAVDRFAISAKLHVDVDLGAADDDRRRPDVVGLLMRITTAWQS